MTIDGEDDLEMPFELPPKADRKAKPMEWPLLPGLPNELATPAAQLRPLAPLTKFADDGSWMHRTLCCSVIKGVLEIRENDERCASLELFWSRVCSGRPSSSTREAYKLETNDMVVLVRPCVRCRHSQSQEQWSFSCRRSWLPYILHYLASEGAVLEKDVENCFRLEGSCGKGGYGTIRRGCPVPSEYYSPCQVAVKVAAEKDVRHELRMLVSAGRHPSVIQHHGAFRGAEQGRGPWSLILEFYPEGDLWHFCTDCLQLHLALSLLHNLLLGLQHIHSRKIFHRDVKPENILVSCERAILCDLGVAELLAESSMRRARGLTPQYASPEMVATNSMNMTGDVYAAGATFHFMITLQYVSTSIKKKWGSWWHSPEPELCFDHAPLSQLPVSCQDLLEKMVCPERKRLTAKEAVRHYAFWSLADPEEDTGTSSKTSGHFFPPLHEGDVSVPLSSVPLSFFGSETLGTASANLKHGVGSQGLGALANCSEASSRGRRSSTGSNSSKPSAGSEPFHGVVACRVIEEVSLDESLEKLKLMLNCPPEPPQKWWRERRKPRPPGVKAPRARRTSVSHWISQQLQAFNDGLPHPSSKRPSRVEPEPLRKQADMVELY